MSVASKLDQSAIEPYLLLDGSEEPSHIARPPRFSTLGRFGQRLAHYPWQFGLSVVAMLLATGATLATPRVVGSLIDNALIPRDTKQLWFHISVFATLEIVRLISTAAQGGLFSRLGQQVLHDIRVALLEKILRLKMSKLDETHTGNLVSRLTADTTALSLVFTSGVVSIIEKLLVVIGIGVVLILLDPLLAAMTLGLFPLLFAAGWLMSRKIYTYIRSLRASVAGVSGFLTESIAGRSMLAVFDRADTQFNRFLLLSRILAAAQRKPVFLNALFHPGMTLVNAITIALIFYFGGQRVLDGHLEVGVLVAFMSYVLWVFWPIIHIVNQWNVVMGGLASAERIFEVFDWPSEPVSNSHDDIGSPRIECLGAIRFENVWFAYRGEEWVLKDVSFTIRPGERIGLVGPTGSGKTTILSLLFGFYTPQRGTIYLDEKPLSEWPLALLRQKLGLVQQDGTLFEGTVEDNVTMFGSRPDAAALEEIEHWAKRPTGSLSAGERQWVAFLRAAARRPAVWILDEAAAHLDPELDQQLHSLVERLGSGGTVIVVAHRLSSVRDMNQIIVMYQGRIVEAGDHQELLKMRGLYARLVELQDADARELDSPEQND